VRFGVADWQHWWLWWCLPPRVGWPRAVAPPNTFGGRLENRPFGAVQSYQQGLVKKILVSNGRQSAAEKLGAAMSDVAVAEGILVKLRLPVGAIEAFGKRPDSHEEVLGLQVWAERNNARSIIVPTEILNLRVACADAASRVWRRTRHPRNHF